MQWHDHYKDLFSILGFRDKDLSSRGHHDQVSTESLHNHGKNSGHSRNLSDGSGSSQQGGVPTGTRVAPLGRETTPTPNAPQRIPREVWDRFEGKTREVITDLKLFQKIVHILLPKLFWHTVRKNASSDQEKLLKFEAEGREFCKLFEITGSIYSNSERS